MRTLLNDRTTVEVDLVVLATGMVSSNYVEPVEGEEKTSGPARGAEANILNLNYRQGKELPELKYGFPDSHFETPRQGLRPGRS